MQYSVFDNLLLLMIPLSFIRDYLSYLLERGDMTLLFGIFDLYLIIWKNIKSVLLFLFTM